MKCADDQRWALVLAGGNGTRLQKLTREITGAPIPKQYCHIANGRSLLQAALRRAEGFTTVARTLVIIKRDHLPLASPQLGSVPERNVIVQPQNRDTGPGLLLSLLSVLRRDPAALLAVLPSDHYLRDEAAFLTHVDRAAEIVKRLPDKIALVGIPPDRVEPGYGYVLPARPLAGTTSAPAFHVAAFYEKPATNVAARLLMQGAMWNSFVMVFRVSRMLELLQRHLPDMVVHFDGVLDNAAALEHVYRNLPPWNFCRDFLHHIPEHLVVVQADGTGWSDWGTPEAVMRTLAELGDEMAWRSHPLRRHRRKGPNPEQSRSGPMNHAALRSRVALFQRNQAVFISGERNATVKQQKEKTTWRACDPT